MTIGLILPRSEPRGERIVTASHDTARIRDTRTGEYVGSPFQHNKAVNTAAFDSTGERIVTGSDDNTARIWDTGTGEQIGKPLQHHSRVRSAAFAPTGERIVTASDDKTARI